MILGEENVEIKKPDLRIPLGIGFMSTYGGLGSFFWYYLIMIIFGGLFNPDIERRFIVYAALFWFAIKILQLIFLLAVKDFTHAPSSEKIRRILLLFILYAITFVIEFIYSLNIGWGVVEWVANLAEIGLLLNMVVIYTMIRQGTTIDGEPVR